MSAFPGPTWYFITQPSKRVHGLRKVAILLPKAQFAEFKGSSHLLVSVGGALCIIDQGRTSVKSLSVLPCVEDSLDGNSSIGIER
jgi:hypothetical protein